MLWEHFIRLISMRDVFGMGCRETYSEYNPPMLILPCPRIRWEVPEFTGFHCANLKGAWPLIALFLDY